MTTQTEVLSAAEFMLQYYAPISAGMASDPVEDRIAEANDIVKNYKQEVVDTMRDTKERLEGYNSLNAKYQQFCEIDETNLTFTISKTYKQ